MKSTFARRIRSVWWCLVTSAVLVLGMESASGATTVLYASDAMATDAVYRNLAALHTALPISAMNYDEEDFSNYHAPSAVTFGKMAGALGMQITLCPYTNPGYWQAVAAGLTNCDYCYLQTYDGGLGNDPANWANLINGSVNGTRGVTVMPLYWDHDRNATYQTNMLAYRLRQ